MFQEIERKFLIKGDFKKDAFQVTEIKQGYLCGGLGVSVRVRAPRHCNTCTKWSYTPQETPENTLLSNDEA